MIRLPVLEKQTKEPDIYRVN